MVKPSEPTKDEMSMSYAVFQGGSEVGEVMSVRRVRLPSATLIGSMNAATILKMPLEQFIIDALADYTRRHMEDLMIETA